MNVHYDSTYRLLQRFLSPAVARALLSRTLKEHKVTQTSLSRADLMRMSNDLRRGARLFVEANHRAEAEQEIARYCGQGLELPQGVSVLVETERDIGKARAEARRLCTECGADAYSMQKIATVVSELARNMVLYANGGKLSIIPQRGSNGSSLEDNTKVVIRASDEGPGIPDIDHVLSGDYRSKTGLGRGLLGTKRLASYFGVSTGKSGTTITAEIPL